MTHIISVNMEFTVFMMSNNDQTIVDEHQKNEMIKRQRHTATYVSLSHVVKSLIILFEFEWCFS